MSRKKLVGTIVADKMEKTVVVEVLRVFHHPSYGKRIRTSKKYLAHCENPDWGLGDQVTIEECRPLSRRKKFEVKGLIAKS